jgi:hypothetical protein
MDDDIEVEPGCLNALLKNVTNREYLYPRVIKSGREEVVSFGWWGVLLAKDLVMRVGLPIAELFYWAEDTEYLQNRIMRVHKVQPLRVHDAVVKHLHRRTKRHPSWYFYYTARNTLYYRSYIIGYNWHRFVRTIYLLPYLFSVILFKERRKVTKIYLLARGVFDGLRGRIGKRVDPEKYN